MTRGSATSSSRSSHVFGSSQAAEEMVEGNVHPAVFNVRDFKSMHAQPDASLSLESAMIHAENDVIVRKKNFIESVQKDSKSRTGHRQSRGFLVPDLQNPFEHTVFEDAQDAWGVLHNVNTGMGYANQALKLANEGLTLDWAKGIASRFTTFSYVNERSQHARHHTQDVPNVLEAGRDIGLENETTRVQGNHRAGRKVSVKTTQFRSAPLVHTDRREFSSESQSLSFNPMTMSGGVSFQEGQGKERHKTHLATTAGGCGRVKP